MPLKAKLDGEDFFAWDLEESNRKDKFDCPHCEDRLIPVLPEEQIIKHFRHKNGEAHGEPETLEHILIKKMVHDAIPGELEHRIGNNVVDVWGIGDHGHNLAIECQCSLISTKEFETRNENYTSNGYDVFWILGGEYLHGMRREWNRRRKIERLLEPHQTLIYSDGKTFFRVRQDTYFDAQINRYRKTSYIVSEITSSRLRKIIDFNFNDIVVKNNYLRRCNNSDDSFKKFERHFFDAEVKT